MAVAEARHRLSCVNLTNALKFDTERVGDLDTFACEERHLQATPSP